MATALAPDPSTRSASGIVSPSRLAHVVLRTSRFEELLGWYKLVLNATPAFESPTIAFLAYDDEHHRIALIKIPGLAPQPEGAAGVHHFAFTYDSLHDLLGNYMRLKEAGVVPIWGVNHGPTTSLYYADPDGNQIECQVDNCPSVEEAGEFFFTDAFAENPIGVDFDPEELYRRLIAGEEENALKRYRREGPRGVEESPLH